MIVTLDVAKDLLQFPRVVQRRYEETVSGTAYEIFSAIPDDARQPGVDVYFNEERDVVDMVSFSYWHGHYDSSEDEDENIRNAFSTARALVHRETCLIEQCNAEGQARGGDIVKIGAFPDTLSHDTRFFRRLVFGEAPRDEAIDFSRYHRGPHLWIALHYKAEVERLYKEHDLPLPEW